MTRPAALAHALIAAGALAVALTGCVPSGPAVTPDPSAPSAIVDEASVDGDPTSTPTDSALADDVLFRITATATAPGGAVVELVETVNVPRAVTPADATDLDANLCDPWRSWTDAQIQDAQIVATSISGSWPADQDISFDLGQWAIFDGDFELAQAYCSPGWLDIPGESHGRHVFPGGDPDAAGGWATQQYGFSSAFDGAPGPGDVVLTACVIELGPGVAGTGTLALAWPTQTQQYPGSSCSFGG
jgi:hypothetical protein